MKDFLSIVSFHVGNLAHFCGQRSLETGEVSGRVRSAPLTGIPISGNNTRHASSLSGLDPTRSQ